MPLPSLGKILKQARLRQRLTQSAVAEGLCSQAMVSAIENDRHTPNAELLLALCQRLSIELNMLTLAKNYAVSATPSLNTQVKQLCNHHCYAELLALLERPEVLTTLRTGAQTQAYYYYLGVATFRATKTPNLTQVRQYLQLSLASATAASQVLAHLSEASLAFIAALNQLNGTAQKWLDKAVLNLDALKFEPNITVIYYLVALTHYVMNHYSQSAVFARRGLETAAMNDSHYMLANLYYLLAIVAQRQESNAAAHSAAQRSRILADVFQERVYHPENPQP